MTYLKVAAFVLLGLSACNLVAALVMENAFVLAPAVGCLLLAAAFWGGVEILRVLQDIRDALVRTEPAPLAGKIEVTPSEPSYQSATEVADAIEAFKKGRSV